MNQTYLTFPERPISDSERPYPVQLGEWILLHEGFPTVMDIALGDKGPLPFRAAWGLSFACAARPERFRPYHSRFIDDFQRVSHESVRREYGKILILLLREKEITLNDETAEAIAETVCCWVTAPDAKIANKVNGLDILLRLSSCVEWVREVLRDLLEKERIDASPGMLNRIRKVEAALARNEQAGPEKAR